MELFRLPIIKRERVLRWPIILAIIVGVGVLGYYGVKTGKISTEIFQKLPAAILEPITKESITEETAEKIVQEAPEIPKIEEKKYLETAEKGEGITHLARRILKKYLQEKPQSFEITPEHKIYIEDYVAKKMGGGWLKLGEKLEISGNLIKEAIEKAENLSPEQLENLTQYSQLVPSLD
ncbi:MAG: hypothetical protein ACE5J0_02555 [Candidatus Paceibacterales bacterium]